MVVSTEREKKKEKKKSESYPIIDKTEEYREKRCTLMVSLVMTEYNLLDWTNMQERVMIIQWI